MKVYRTKVRRVAGTRYREVYDEAFDLYIQLKKQTKRRPYVRSRYFKGQKVFLDLFWRHLHEKNWRDRARRIRFFPAAVELLRHSTFLPESKENPNDRNELLHRFAGITQDEHLFYVQIREEKRSGNKSMFSVFPEQKQDNIRR